MDEQSSGGVAPKDTILTVYDDFVEFVDHCSFLCDAVSSLFSEITDLDADDHTVMGLKRSCNSLKERAEKIELALNSLYKSSYTAAQITTIKPRT